MTVTSSPETNDQLLSRLCNHDDLEAWLDFVEVYRKSIYQVGRRFGLQDADAQNLVQDVLQKIERKIPQWKAGQPPGSFRRWLSTVARNTAIDAIRREKPDSASGGTSIQRQLNQLPEREDNFNTELQVEVERQIFRKAAKRIQNEFTESTWIAFWETMVVGRPTSDVANQLKKSVGAIYTARSRVMQRLKQEVDSLSWQTKSNSES